MTLLFCLSWLSKNLFQEKLSIQTSLDVKIKQVNDLQRENSVSKEEINKKFANKKAISSEDYANLEDNSHESSAAKNKLQGMKYSQAISSSDLYGNNADDYSK